MKALLCLVITNLIVNVCAGYKLLLVFPYTSRSHAILGESYARHLVRAGHEVTLITAYPMKEKHPNLRQIDVSSNLEKFNIQMADFTIEKLLNKEIDVTVKQILFTINLVFANNTITHRSVQNLIQDPKEEFDAVVLEWMYSELYAGFSAVFNCPFIWSSSMEPHAMVLSLIDENPNTAYTPDHTSSLEPPFTFMERVEELWTILAFKYVRWFFRSIEDESYKNAFGPAIKKRGRNLPSLEEVKFNASLLLGNSHVSSGLPLRLPQNYKPIGGYHISEDIEPLPEDLQNMMDNAKNGVIYFSLGSILQSKTLPDVIKKGLLKTFSGLKQTVIWKFEETLPDLPKNVHIVQWAPQSSILAHPNCVLFITHGGLLSTMEALHYGIPIIGIPLFADQFINVKRAQSKGFGKEVVLGYDIPEKLKAAIEEVLGNPRYREKVKELSLVYHDRPVRPGVELVHWVEHVARTRGAAHLRSPALFVPAYQKMYLDLIAVIVLLLFVIYKIIKQVLSILYSVNKYDIKKKYS